MLNWDYRCISFGKKLKVNSIFCLYRIDNNDDADWMIPNNNSDPGCQLLLKRINPNSQQLLKEKRQTNQAKQFTIKLTAVMFLTHVFAVLITQYCDKV